MISWDVVWKRQMECQSAWVKGKVKSDFRSVYYTQKFTNIALGASSGNTLQTFPAGAFILGIDACAKIPRIIKTIQYYADATAAPNNSTVDRLLDGTAGNLDAFSLNFQYTNDEIITPGGPCLASALMGPHGGLFPARELIVDPSQGILCSAKNELVLQLIDGSVAPAGVTVSIDVHVRYACMVPRAVG